MFFHASSPHHDLDGGHHRTTFEFRKGIDATESIGTPRIGDSGQPLQAGPQRRLCHWFGAEETGATNFVRVPHWTQQKV